MSQSKFLAFDLGAESGRAVLGLLSGTSISLEEIHRFPNKQLNIQGHTHWDIHNLFDEIKIGLTKTSGLGHKKISGLGIDTWGIDFGLIDKENRLLGNPFTYRDSRTNGMMEKVFARLPKEKIYSLTGIQFMQINTIYQLFSMADSNDPLLETADSLLFTPDLLNFFLTGEKYSEYTIASTSQLLNAKGRHWEFEIFKTLDIPEKIMPPVINPGTCIGSLLPDISAGTGLTSAEIIAPACHDTACAVAAVPVSAKNWAYLSSGTWSLLGIETGEPILDADALEYNFTNEGGFNNTIRFLKNTMGLWLLQKSFKKWNKENPELTYERLVELASKSSPFKCVVDPDDPSFLNPEDMPGAIVKFCRKTNQKIPENTGEITRCIFESLALKYRFIIDQINKMRSGAVEVLHIVGGGSQNELLNQFSANSTGLQVIAGPVEATVLGNIIIQAICKNELNSINEGRDLVRKSFPLKVYEPENRNTWEAYYQGKKHHFSV